jgi:hypothetical protein
MAKDSFFIRASVDAANGAFSQTALGLGSYVDALGKSVLRIHNISVQYRDATNASAPPLSNGLGTRAETVYQLTTQSKTAIAYADDRSTIASGMCEAAEQTTGQLTNEASDLSPQVWTNGYLIGVEEIYLGGHQSGMVNPTRISIVLECTVETLSQSASMALALSQQ